jgi:methionine-rich copper-binding protein CopC
MTRVTRSPRAPTVVALATALALLCAPDAALAHAHPDHADPKVGSTVHSSPSEVRIWFDGELEPASCSISVQGPGGSRVDDGHGGVDPSDPRLLETAVQPLQPGTHQVTWSVVARDGHHTSGHYEFTVR